MELKQPDYSEEWEKLVDEQIHEKGDEKETGMHLLIRKMM